jgi:hypothetical protein
LQATLALQAALALLASGTCRAGGTLQAPLALQAAFTTLALGSLRPWRARRPGNAWLAVLSGFALQARLPLLALRSL